MRAALHPRETVMVLNSNVIRLPMQALHLQIASAQLCPS